MSKPVLLDSPEHCPSAYVMHFYCKYENPEHGFQAFPKEADQVETRGEAIRQMQNSGWVFHYRDSTATCPKCAKALRLK